MDVSFPPRNDSFDFRNQLEVKYQTGLGRGISPTVVDKEGEVVWTQEYMRYRTNGCDHGTAVQRVLTQIDGNAAGGVCGAPPDGLILFPSRSDSLEFRRTLEIEVRVDGARPEPDDGRRRGRRGLDAGIPPLPRQRVRPPHIGPEGVLADRRRRRVADVLRAAVRIFGVASVCTRCRPSGGTFTITVTRTPGAAATCTYTAESLSAFISITDAGTGTTGGTVTYTVPANTGPARSGQIRVRWPNGSTLVDINQGGSFLNAQILLVDPAQSTQPTSVCHDQDHGHECQLIANANLSGTSTFTWTVTYSYNGVVTRTQSNTSNVFTFTETCGVPGASTGGTDTPMNVTLTVTDPNNVSETTTAQFTIRLYTC